MSDYKYIRVEQEAHVAEVVLDRPEKLNAMPFELFYEIREVFGKLDHDESVRAIVLWAEGRLFTAGLDLKSAGTGLLGGGSGGNGDGGKHDRSEARSNLDMYDTVLKLQACFTAIQDCRKPVIAAVHGKCIGGGVDLTTACDFRVCTEDAEFSIFETKIAIVADVGTLQRITAIVGKGMAREMAFTGGFFGADRALATGLVNRVYADKDSMLEGARATANEIAANSPLTVQGVKQVLNYSDEHSTDEGLDHVAQWNSSFLRSDDLAEAMQAFAEKRPPRFEGR
ncbi:MAG: crotonase/enoyl-CoA hydratase family protein [Proteobacteria bacterium]|nr:crotonase/enoyl-CoA hydratase family protein [Pseudomonadota bacterium]